MSDEPIKHAITPETLRELQELGMEGIIPDSVTVSDPASDDPNEERILICCAKGDYTPFTDNINGKCSSCNTDIFFRPHAPKNITRLCLKCASIRLGQQSVQ